MSISASETEPVKWEPKIYRCYSPNGDLISITIKRTPDGEREQIHPPKFEVPCKTHPDAPHGFDRNASHSADRYVCECEGWEPDLAKVGEVGVWGHKREWVGLDEVEITGMTCECVDDGTFNMACAHDFARAIEKALKEKNT